MEQIQIRMLGEFSLSVGDISISDTSNRAKKVWVLLAYLIFHRSRTVSVKELVSALWSEKPASSNPENLLRITFHRARTLLNRLWPDAGHQLIQYRESGYTWNQNVPVWLDVNVFDAFCQTSTEDEETLLDAYLQALELYQGDFLKRHVTEAWVIPVTSHYHNLYLETALKAAPLLSKKGQHKKSVEILRRAITIDPYHEALYQLLMKELAALNDLIGASIVYDELKKQLFHDFGIQPNDETRAVYREIARELNGDALAMESVMEHVHEKQMPETALQCEYDYFKILCHVEARSMLRSGKPTHIALISVLGHTDGPLPKHRLELAMKQMGEQIQTNLRRGDVFSRCSLSQYIIMLPEANYENSCMVCRRLIGAFSRKHPHSPAWLHFMVQPLSPGISVP